MASASTAPLEPVSKAEDAVAPAAEDITSRADMLYEECAKRPEGTTFFQRDLTSMQIARDLNELLNLVGDLSNRHLLKPLQFEGEPCWKLRPKDIAEKLRRLVPDERLLYQHIDNAHTEGVWSKALRAKTNLAQPTVTKYLKSLESKDLIQAVMSVKTPNRKMYLLKHLKPSEDVAGGPWQNEGDFDSALIEVAAKVIGNKVQEETCIRVSGTWNNYASSDRQAAIAHKKAQVKGVPDIEEALPVQPYHPPVDPSASRLVHRSNPFYPTTLGLAKYLNSIQLLRGKTVRESDMEQLLEMMVLEGTLEKVTATAYRTVLPISDQKYNGFVDAPCGNCPVFDLCSDEGPITARTCAYFAEWLDTTSEEP
ncbi:34-kDa subunit of RNA polymerase III (C) [Didymosphaeria variabile]|uniref:DNA-directed RNA polymerase III subunit RPC6 n=1 Tax=Didymosphaeria variabile TaxID=1932322 RepID=A0A9W8XIP1_9PLEO|nr:34-kDa subunit of RNA polymerase III (C) [Didymosphaeria variabile]KAJ4351988.1 34-kDa subunit of RNA polymerase III (C) [Didymosphaeria variabile]